LFAAAACLRDTIGAPLPPADYTGYESSLAAAVAQLGEATFAAAWEAGRAMPFEQAIAEAVELGDGG
jgi:hypothetical protein